MSDYDLIPNNELLKLRKEIDRLKGGKDSSEITDSIENLTKSIEILNELFYSATQEMKAEEKSEHTIIKKIEPILDKLDEISEQNTKIAKAIIALTEMIKEKRHSPSPGPMFRTPAASPAPSFRMSSSAPRFTPPKRGSFK